MGTLVYRQLRFSELSRIFIDSGLTTAIILFIIGTANILAWVLASQQVPQRLSAFFLSFGSNAYFILFLVNLGDLVKSRPKDGKVKSSRCKARKT